MDASAVFASRRDKLRAILRREDLAALLVSLAANRYYLSGFELHNPQENESSGMLLVCADGQDILYTDSRFRDTALRIWPEKNLRIYSGKVPEVIAESVSSLVRGSLGLEARALSLAFYEEFCPCLGDGIKARSTSGLVEGLRQIKSADEIARIGAACTLNHELMRYLPSLLVPGISERETAFEAEKFFRERGASELAFPTIVGYAKNAALPHCIPGEDILEDESLVLVDAGCRLQGYCSDQTRTFWVGRKPSASFRETLAAVQEAQRKAIELIRPGVPANEVFQAAWDHFERLGVAERFTHSLGHGVGLETHEGPSLNRNNSRPLEPGMVITVEPGLYDASWGGVRWEHMVAVTSDGCRVL